MTAVLLPADLLTVRLLGRPCWQTGAGESGALSAQNGALLALLALDGPQARDTLAGRLWPHASPKRAAGNLRKQVSRLRGEVKHRIFSTGATLALLDGVQVDVAQIPQMPPERLLDAELLAGCDYTECEFLHEWIGERTASLRAMRADALAAHAEALERRDELAAAIRLAERTVELSPLQEHSVRRLMRLHFRRGDSVAAIACFERFERRLHDETGARPGAETIRLLDTVERGAAGSSPPVRVIPVSLVRPPVLVGREAEWATMQAAWDGSRSFVLVGEAGIGKSRLLNDFAQGRTGLVTERGRAGDAQTPYYLLARLLRGVLSLPVSVRLPEGLLRRELARLLPELGLPPETPADEGLLRHAAEQLLTEALGCGGLTALVVDDLHVADLASLEALRWLAASPALAALRLGLAARSLDATPAGAFLADWLDDSCRPVGIELAPLRAGQIETLLASLGLPELASPGLGARLHAHAGGQPLFTLETLKDRWLRGHDEHDAALPNPSTVQALIERRLRNLPASAMALLRAAAICGEDLDPERAAALLAVEPVTLVAAWAALEHANVLNGKRFAHGLMFECAQRLVPEPLQRSLHAALAEILVGDAQAAPACVAEHWQAAERWSPAGIWWQRAAARARLAGRLPEQQLLGERAAACFRKAGDPAGEFAAVHAGFEGLQVRQGGTAVLAALPRLEALARGADERVHCKLVEAEALLELERSREALASATDAVALALDRPLLSGDALCLQGMAYGQLGRADEAVATSRRAVDAAIASGSAGQELRALRALGYVLYRLGRLGDAVPVQTRLLALAHELGDAPDTAAAEASLAGLLGATGDTVASLDHARRAQAAYDQMGLTRNSTNGAINLCVLGRAAAYLGRFEEAAEALEAAQAMASDGAAVPVQAKARITLAAMRLTLGDAAAARELVATLPTGSPPGMRMQAAWVLASAERIEGGSGRSHLERLGRLGVEHPDLPLVQSAWLEWSYQGAAADVVAQLRRIRERFQAMGLAGTVRSLLLRETARLAELDDADDGVSIAQAADNAPALAPWIDTGLHASSYPPEAWATLAQAQRRAGSSGAADESWRRGRAWILEVALPHVAAADRERFLERNPVNRQLLAAGP